MSEMQINKLPRGVLEIPKGATMNLYDGNDFKSKTKQIKYYLQQLDGLDSDNNAIIKHKLQEAYLYIIVNFCKESIMQKMEQDFWNNIFKKSISELQSKIRNTDKLENAAAQVKFSTFIEYSIGVYQNLLDLLSRKYCVVLPGISLNEKHDGSNDSMNDMSEKDIRYIVQYCYIHIGDLFRYQGDIKGAKFYYKLSVQVEPYSGHAYNQLAIIESANVNHASILSNNFENYLQTLLYYDYACTCMNPFPATRINLESILRQIADLSVSELLTSGNKAIDDSLFYIISGWLHVYAESRLRNNIQRCKQLQQRIIEWVYEYYRRNITNANYKVVVQMMTLQCGLISNFMDQQNSSETQLWSTNIQQFTMDLLNSLSRAICSYGNEKTRLHEVFKNPAIVGFITIFLCWIKQYIVSNEINKESPQHRTNLCPIKVPFGEDFIKLINSLLNESDVLSMVKEEKNAKLPFELIEIEYIRGYEPLKVPYLKYDIYSGNYVQQKCKSMGNSDERIIFVLSVCKQLANKWKKLLNYNDKDKLFTAVTIEPEIIEKKLSLSNGHRNKPVNIALQSLRNNKRENNVKGSGNIQQSTQINTVNDTPVSGIVDTKIAKFIQEQVASSTVSVTNAENTEPSNVNSNKTNFTPGLILSSNLPPNYQNMSNVSSQVSNQSLQNENQNKRDVNQMNTNKSLISEIPKYPSKTYNPNRELFEKDLPPRFANKRTGQKENKTGFSSMNFWDNMKSEENIPPTTQQDLAKKESELFNPPTVPSSWLNESKTENNFDQSRLLFNQANSQMSYYDKESNNTKMRNPNYQLNNGDIQQSNQNYPSFMNSTKSYPKYFLQAQTSDLPPPPPQFISSSSSSLGMNCMNNTTNFSTQLPLPQQAQISRNHQYLPSNTTKYMYNDTNNIDVSNNTTNLLSFQSQQPQFSQSHNFQFNMTTQNDLNNQSVIQTMSNNINSNLPMRHTNPLLNLLPGYNKDENMR